MKPHPAVQGGRASNHESQGDTTQLITHAQEQTLHNSHEYYWLTPHNSSLFLRTVSNRRCLAWNITLYHQRTRSVTDKVADFEAQKPSSLPQG